jgi:hypothetical protein
MKDSLSGGSVPRSKSNPSFRKKKSMRKYRYANEVHPAMRYWSFASD